ncbi:helix-turn-helix transcriptional regulator [Kineococcus arenarius]|uniref:helix-turn-helix transcriptional regulator n=1 Tax=Kineococcus sp. SYSU DK007 TaxID=3383128 RepID=UPI003D7EC185
MPEQRPETLATALRRWRDRLSPRDVGLPERPGRRAPGLRREDLADLAGLSVDYVVRLEQGRAVNPSAQVVGALARALQLDRAERDHLHRLAGLLPPADGLVDGHVPPGVQRVVARLGDLPVAVFAADWTLLSWNRPWAALLGEPGADRNLALAAFGLAPAVSGSAVAHDDDALAAALVGDLRTVAAAHPRDRGLAELLARLRTGSPRFARLWDSGAVGAHVSARKTVHHPRVGDLLLDCDVLAAPGSDVRVVVYSAVPGSPDAEALEFLRVTSGAEPVPAAAPTTGG